jgi:hypothetical protein
MLKETICTSGFERNVRNWHETVMSMQSPHVCCWGQSGPHLLEGSISHFDPERTLARRAGGNYVMFRPSALGAVQ